MGVAPEGAKFGVRGGPLLPRKREIDEAVGGGPVEGLGMGSGTNEIAFHGVKTG
jgi:hypothetical protein